MKRYSKLQTCPLVILYSISANSPSKQQGGRHIVIGAMGSVDRVITLGGGWGGGRKPETGIIYIYIYYTYIYIYIIHIYIYIDSQFDIVSNVIIPFILMFPPFQLTDILTLTNVSTSLHFGFYQPVPKRKLSVHMFFSPRA